MTSERTCPADLAARLPIQVRPSRQLRKDCLLTPGRGVGALILQPYPTVFDGQRLFWLRRCPPPHVILKEMLETPARRSHEAGSSSRSLLEGPHRPRSNLSGGWLRNPRYTGRPPILWSSETATDINLVEPERIVADLATLTASHPSVLPAGRRFDYARPDIVLGDGGNPLKALTNSAPGVGVPTFGPERPSRAPSVQCSTSVLRTGHRS